MEYSYYPGCSLESTSKAYDESTRAVTKELGINLKELNDWNCCGATTYMSVKELMAFSISARNLALVEYEKKDTLVTPCSACYTNLNKTNQYFRNDKKLREKISSALSAAGLTYNGGVTVKHLLQLFVEDIGLQKIHNAVKHPLEGLKVAPYYGCQIIRPNYGFDDPEFPSTLDNLVTQLGAEPVDFAMKARCCGASLMATKEELALRMCKNILLSAEQSNADCIVTTCPLCQINLDAYQSKINEMYEKEFKFPILYFTQLIGMALKIPYEQLGLQRCFVPVQPVLDRFLTV